ncbi:MAG: serine hydrolase [Blastocatellia bacterium]|nr:serine hydrolase [Blastocatellia bacterium]
MSTRQRPTASKPHRHTVFRVVPVILGILLTASTVFGLPQNKLDGHWEGAITLPTGPLSMSVEIAVATDGKYTATISIPQQGARDLPLSNVSCTGSEVSLDLPNVPGDPKFRGKLSAEGQKIEGTFTQGGGSFPFLLERKADPAASARQALAGYDELVTDAMKKLEVPGVAIAIVKNKEIIFAKGFGWRDVEHKSPVTADTLFPIGSSSKAFTTFVLGTLVDEGRIEWDKPVRNYIPWFKMYNRDLTEHLTVRDLVTHRSGLPRHDGVWYNNYDASREALVRKLAFLEPNADLREKFQYNNLMFLTAGYLTETSTGKSWEENVRERILVPLAMKRTNFSVADLQKDADFSYGYGKREGKIEKLPFRPITNVGPAGSINSSVNEMARWVMVHLNDGKYADKQLAEGSTVADLHQAYMTTGVTNPETEITGGEYALGWFVDTYRGHRRVMHGGNIDGFSANVVLFPKDGIGIVVLTNLDATPLRGVAALVAADRLFNLKPIDWVNQAVGRRTQSEKAAEEGKSKTSAVRVSGTKTSHAVQDFSGEYEHPGYGVLKINRTGEKLEALYNGIVTPLEHWHYDTFNGQKSKDPTFEDMKYTFQTDVNGFIASVSAPFEPAVKDIVFVKKPDARLSDPAYLAGLTGEFDLLGQTLKITVKGTALVLNIAGQPQLDLLPTLGGDFKIKQEQQVSLHFQADDKGNVTAVEIRQPSTVLTAKRKN